MQYVHSTTLQISVDTHSEVLVEENAAVNVNVDRASRQDCDRSVDSARFAVAFEFAHQCEDVRKHASGTGEDNRTRQYHHWLAQSSESIVVYRRGIVIFANAAAHHLLGVRHTGALIGTNLFDHVHPDWHGQFNEPLEPASRGTVAEQVWIRTDGTRLLAEVEVSSVTFFDASAVQLVIRNASERSRAQRLHAAQNHILHMIATRSPLTQILHEIGQLTRKFAPHCICSIKLHDTFDAQPGDHAMIFERAKGELSMCSSWTIFGNNRRSLGTYSFRPLHAAKLSFDDFKLFGVCCQLAALAIEHHLEDESLRRLAYYDGLTSLPNRFLFRERLEYALENARRHQRKCAVLFIDLDKFKEVNDRYGHDAGDAVLREFASRFKNCIRLTDTVARMGGDEFYVLLEELGDARYIARVSQKLLAEASRPFYLGDHECQLSASIGVAIYPNDGLDAPSLLRNADHAMFHVKRHGRDGMQFCARSSERYTAI